MVVVIGRQPDPAGTGGVRCGSPRRAGCGQPVRWGWIEDARDPRLVTRVVLEPGPDPDGRFVQTGWHAGEPRVRAMGRHETPPAGAKCWVPHAATCPAGTRRMRRPRAVQLELDVGAGAGRR